MKLRWSFLIFTIFSMQLLANESNSKTKTTISKNISFKNIMVSLNPYHSIDEALSEEHLINWDQEHDKVDAVTDAFSASELQLHFNLLGKKLKILPYQPDSIGKTIVLIDENLFKKHHSKLASKTIFNELGEQGFAIVVEKKALYIVAKTRIGRLYGAYEFLKEMGFSWYNPKEIIIPKKIKPYLKSYETLKTPKILLRGFWTVSENNLPKEYALWLARNKFNLTGKVEKNLAKKLGLKIWGGGHEIIQEEFSKKELFSKYPEWYILNKNKRHPVSMKVNYVNPSFANKDGADYFSEQLIKRLNEGDLKNIDVLNIWPADKKRFLKDESEIAQDLGNFSDTLLHFYLIIANNLQQAYEHNKLSRRVTLAGISYHQTLMPPTNKKIIKELETKNYLHLFYPSTRDWTFALNTNKDLSPTNFNLSKAINSWKEVSDFTFGFVDYNHKSNYYGIAITNHTNLALDFDYYFPEEGGLYAYMHPIKNNPGPFELTNTLISEMLWQQPSDQNEHLQAKTTTRYFNSKYGKWSNEWNDIYNKMMLAVSNSKHIFERGSLSSVLFQKVYWAKPPFKDEQAIALIESFKEGGLQHLPDGYTNKMDELGSSKFIGLNESLATQQRLRKKWNSISKNVKNQTIQKRMINDIEWFETSLKRYELMSLCVDFSMAEYQNKDAGDIKTAIKAKIDSLYQAKPTHDVFSNDHKGAFLKTVEKFIAGELR